MLTSLSPPPVWWLVLRYSSLGQTYVSLCSRRAAWPTPPCSPRRPSPSAASSRQWKFHCKPKVILVRQSLTSAVYENITLIGQLYWLISMPRLFPIVVKLSGWGRWPKPWFSIASYNKDTDAGQRLYNVNLIIICPNMLFPLGTIKPIIWLQSRKELVKTWYYVISPIKSGFDEPLKI